MSKVNKEVLLMLILTVVLSSGVMIACGEKAPAQEPPLPLPPAQAPVVLNDSIVTGKVVAVRSLSESLDWEIDIEVQSSQDVPGYPNSTKEKIGQVISVRTEENAARLKVGQVITTHVRLEGDERGRFYFAWDIQ